MTLVILLVIAGLFAQTSIFDKDDLYKDSFFSGTMLNPYKLKVSHSMGFSAGSSSNGTGFYESRYTNHLKYEFSPKLNLALDLNFVNFGSTTTGNGFSFQTNDDNKSRILPEFSLSYKPNNSITIQLDYKNYRNYYNPWLGHRPDWME